MLTCPRCRTRLLRATTAIGFVYPCATCRGRAVALPVMRKAAPPSLARALWNRADQSPRRSALGCPVCRRPMIAADLPVGASTVELDLCRSCQLAWFDAQEFDRLPRTEAQEPSIHDWPDSVREKYALAQLEADQRREALIARRDAHSGGSEEWPENGWKVIPAMLGLPIEHEPVPLYSLPWLTWALAVVLALCFAATWQDIPAAAEALGLIPARAGRFGGLTLLTSFFLHGGFWHLIANVYFLLVFGDNVEDDLGRARYAALLGAAVLLGGVFHILGEPRSDVPLIGASGGIAGVIVYYALRYPRARVGVALRYGIYFKYLSMPAYVGLIFWIVLQFFMAWEQLAGVTNVSALAHLGGAVVGFAARTIQIIGAARERAVAPPRPEHPLAGPPPPRPRR